MPFRGPESNFKYKTLENKDRKSEFLTGRKLGKHQYLMVAWNWILNE